MAAASLLDPPAVPSRDVIGGVAGAFPPLLLASALVLALPGTGLAHEAWLLTPEHMADWNARPKPELFTHLTGTNAVMLAAAVLGIVGWVLLATAGRGRLAQAWTWPRIDERRTGLFLRGCLALTLVMAALGLHPRHGTGLMEASTLAFPDLELRLLGGGWGWLAPVELALAVGLLIGPCVRAAAMGVLLLTLLGLQLFGADMLAYAGALAGAAAYLIVGDGSPRPGTGSWPRERALFLVRVLTGATFLWCGVHYKILQPNLVLAIIVEGGVPTFGLGPEAFVFGMALVEVSAGALMMTGLLVRPLALLLLGPFFFLSAALGENPLGHVLFYGNLIVLAAGGAGSWRVAAGRAALDRLAASAPSG